MHACACDSDISYYLLRINNLRDLKLASGMDSGGLYRHGIPSSITRQQGASTTGFYGPSVSGSGSSINGQRFIGHVPPGELEKRIDQMMGMFPGTQQLMLAQQATTQRLEDSVAKINATLQTDMKKMSEEVGQSTQEKENQQKKFLQS